MRGLLLLVLALLAPLVAVPASAEVAPAPLPPPPSANTKPVIRIVSFAAPPATLTCATGTARLIEGAALHPKIWQVWTPPVMPMGLPPIPPQVAPTSDVYTFSVNAEGRVTDLKHANGVAYWNADEQAAIIASWGFAPGAAARDCKIDLAPVTAPIADAPPARLFEILAAEGPKSPPVLREAIAKAGNCGEAPRRRPQMMFYPDLRRFDDRTVDPAWAALRYDIDAKGAVRNVAIVVQHGEAAFADTAASAIAEGRYYAGSNRTGCFATFRALPRVSEAPSRPEAKAFDRPTDACEVKAAALNIPETKFFPPAYAARRVSGWAFIRFDVAPWGQVGSVEILASQPSAAFGEAARLLIQSARPSPPATGYRGCVIPIIYAVPPVPEDEG